MAIESESIPESISVSVNEPSKGNVVGKRFRKCFEMI